MNDLDTLSSNSPVDGSNPLSETAELVAAVIAENPLPPEQVTALIALVVGRRPAEAARAAGVHRATLYRWIKKDAIFKAALAECREAGRATVQDQFLAMVDDCMDAVSTAILQGNAYVALHVLKLMRTWDTQAHNSSQE